MDLLPHYFHIIVLLVVLADVECIVHILLSPTTPRPYGIRNEASGTYTIIIIISLHLWNLNPFIRFFTIIMCRLEQNYPSLFLFSYAFV